MAHVVRVKLEGRWHTVEVGDLSERPVRAVVDGVSVEVDVGDAARDALAPAAVSAVSAVAAPARGAPPPAVRRAPAPTSTSSPSAAAPPGAVASEPANPNKVFSAPMPGIILEISVKPGDQVVTGDTICVLEAMKMQQRLRADWSGVVKSVLVAVGQQVMDGAPIVELE